MNLEGHKSLQWLVVTLLGFAPTEKAENKTLLSTCKSPSYFFFNKIIMFAACKNASPAHRLHDLQVKAINP